jgi:hypothetical protein
MATSSAPPARRTISTFEEAEVLARDHMAWLGYPDARVTPPGRDGGIDASGFCQHICTFVSVPVKVKQAGAEPIGASCVIKSDALREAKDGPGISHVVQSSRTPIQP